MSDEVLADLDFPAPDRFLRVGSGAHGEQTAKVMLAVRGGPPRGAPRRGRRRGRRQLDARLRARRRQARHPGRARRGGPALVRLEHARGDQPRPHRPPLRPALHAQPGGDREPARRGHRRRPHPLRRQHDDRLAAPLPSARARSAARWEAVGASSGEYVLVTLHRPSNVDDPARLARDRRRARRRSPRARPSSSRSTRAPARGSSDGGAGAARGRRRALHRAASATSTSCRCRPAPARSSPTPAASRRRPPRSASRCYTFRPEHGAPGHAHARHERAARRRPGGARRGPPVARGTRRRRAIPLWDGHAGERVADVLVANYALVRPVAVAAPCAEPRPLMIVCSSGRAPAADARAARRVGATSSACG